MSLGDLLAGAPDVAVHLGDRAVGRDELVAEADALASRLADAGVGPGQAVAVALPNGPEVVAALFGVWRAGAVYTPLNPRAPEEEQEAVLQAVGPAASLTEAGLATVDGAATQDPGVALVQFTSGTTGRPKPVPLRHDAVGDLLDRVVASIRGRSSDRGGSRADRAPMPNLVPVSLSLWAGIYQVLFAFRVGAPVVLMERFDTSEFARLVDRFGIRSTVLPPAAMAMLTDDPAVTDLSPLRMVRSITAPLSPARARRFRDRFGVVVLNSYGQTELGGEVVGWTAADSRDHGEDKLGSVGRPHAGVQVRTDAGGELLVRTPATTSGSVSADFADRLDGDGWFRTGDLGRVDEDGFVWVDGRVSDMINRGGLKVFPAQVEEVLSAEPSVRDAAVVGVPDDRLGEVPWAFVVPAAGARLDADALLAACRARLTPYKVPVRVVEVDELPRTEVGKVRARDLLAMAEAEGGDRG
jgi:long-chain acyl-CoA synthetase